MNEAANRDSAAGSLEGYRVVDIGPRIASAFAAKHLAELGRRLCALRLRARPYPTDSPFVSEP